MKKTQYTLEDIEKSTAPISDAWYGADDLYAPLCDDWYVPLCDAWYGAGDAWYGAGADECYVPLCDDLYGSGADECYDDLCDDENENEDAEEEAVEDVTARGVDDVTIRLSDMDGDATQILFEFAVEVTADIFDGKPDKFDSIRADFLRDLHCALCHHAYSCADRFPDDSMTYAYRNGDIVITVTGEDGTGITVIDLSDKQNTYIFG